jgi:hypothetical protein
MATLLLDDRTILNKKYPALTNFPFTDFQLEVGELPSAPKPMPAPDMIESKPSKYDSPVIKFTMARVAKFSINIHENDLVWIFDRADTVNQLDTTAKLLEEALSSNDLLFRRDVSVIADDWIKRLADTKTMLTYSTFADVLTALIGERSILDATKLINNINKLANKRGIVKLTPSEYQVIMTYYEFRLVYTKLILGLVIAAKISL